MVMHASAWAMTALPLCGARKYTYVTMNLQNVTCENCLRIVETRTVRAIKTSVQSLAPQIPGPTIRSSSLVATVRSH